MKKTLLAALAVAPMLFGAVGAADAAQARIGILNCEVADSQGFIFGSTKALDCRFLPSDPAERAEHYAGAISKFGVDLGFTNRGVMSWAVLAADFNDYSRGALAGHYSGASAEATVALGVGANVLVGPRLDTFVLQPLSVGTQTGLNVALGVAGLDLITATK